MAKRDEEGTLETRAEARAVRGKVIGPRFGPLLSNAGCGLLAALAGLGGLTLVNSRLIVLTARLYGFIALGALFAVGYGLVAFVILLRNRRLVVGKDRVQLIGAFSRVLGQLPYDNILDARTSTECGVAITLDSTRRDDTWWPSWEDRDCDVLIRANAETDATGLRLDLRDALRKYRQRHGGRSWQE